MAVEVHDSTEDPAATLHRDFCGARVLITDDDEFIRSVLVEALSDTGLQFDEAEDGMKAVHLCRQTCYSLLLMDIQMPGITGMEATRQIRQLPGMQCTPILAITGSTSDADRNSYLSAGMTDCLSKPIGNRALAAIILRWLRHNPS
jgi:hypothetical protein